MLRPYITFPINFLYMSSTTSITELRSMLLIDLRKEIRAHQTEVQKMRLQITMNTEKDTARYRREKRQLARMMTVMTEKQKGTEVTEGAKVTEVLKKKPKTSTIPARKTSKPRA